MTTLVLLDKPGIDAGRDVVRAVLWPLVLVVAVVRDSMEEVTVADIQLWKTAEVVAVVYAAVAGVLIVGRMLYLGSPTAPRVLPGFVDFVVARSLLWPLEVAVSVAVEFFRILRRR